MCAIVILLGVQYSILAFFFADESQAVAVILRTANSCWTTWRYAYITEVMIILPTLLSLLFHKLTELCSSSTLKTTNGKVGDCSIDCAE